MNAALKGLHIHSLNNFSSINESHTWGTEGLVMKMQMGMQLLVELNSAHPVMKKDEEGGPS